MKGSEPRIYDFGFCARLIRERWTGCSKGLRSYNVLLVAGSVLSFKSRLPLLGGTLGLLISSLIVAKWTQFTYNLEVCLNATQIDLLKTVLLRQAQLNVDSVLAYGMPRPPSTTRFRVWELRFSVWV